MQRWPADESSGNNHLSNNNDKILSLLGCESNALNNGGAASADIIDNNNLLTTTTSQPNTTHHQQQQQQFSNSSPLLFLPPKSSSLNDYDNNNNIQNFHEPITTLPTITTLVNHRGCCDDANDDDGTPTIQTTRLSFKSTQPLLSDDNNHFPTTISSTSTTSNNHHDELSKNLVTLASSKVIVTLEEQEQPSTTTTINSSSNLVAVNNQYKPPKSSSSTSSYSINNLNLNNNNNNNLMMVRNNALSPNSCNSSSIGGMSTSPTTPRSNNTITPRSSNDTSSLNTLTSPQAEDSNNNNSNGKLLSGKMFKHLANYLNHVQTKKQQIHETMEREAKLHNNRVGYANNSVSSTITPSTPSASTIINNTPIISSPSSDLHHHHLNHHNNSWDNDHNNNKTVKSPTTTTNTITSPTTSSSSFVSSPSSHFVSPTTTTGQLSGNNVAIINGKRVAVNFNTSSQQLNNHGKSQSFYHSLQRQQSTTTTATTATTPTTTNHSISTSKSPTTNNTSPIISNLLDHKNPSTFNTTNLTASPTLSPVKLSVFNENFTSTNLTTTTPPSTSVTSTLNTTTTNSPPPLSSDHSPSRTPTSNKSIRQRGNSNDATGSGGGTNSSSEKVKYPNLNLNFKNSLDDHQHVDPFHHDGMISVRSISSVTSYTDHDLLTPRIDIGAIGQTNKINNGNHTNEVVAVMGNRKRNYARQQPIHPGKRRSNSMAASSFSHHYQNDYVVDIKHHISDSVAASATNNSLLGSPVVQVENNFKLPVAASKPSSGGDSINILNLINNNNSSSNNSNSSNMVVLEKLKSSPHTPTKNAITNAAIIGRFNSPVKAASSSNLLSFTNQVAASAFKEPTTPTRGAAPISVNTPLKQVGSSLSFYIPKLTPLSEVAKNSNIIIHSAKNGCVALLECILDDTNVNNVRDNHNGNSLLQIAIQHNQVEVVALMLSKFDVNLNHTNKIEGTALHVAATKGNSDVLTMLLTATSKTGVKKLDWARKDTYGNAAIHLATDNRDCKSIETMILLGVSPTLKKRDSGVTALHIAASKGYPEIVKLLLDFYTEPITFSNMRDDNGLTALMRSVICVHCNDKMETDEFLERFQPSYYPNSPLGSLEKFIRTNSRNWNRDLTEIERQNYMRVWLFLLNEIDYRACCTVKTIAHGLNLFHLAAMANNVVFLHLCVLSLPEDLYRKLFYEQDKHEGFTPLHLACWFNNASVVELFLSVATENQEEIQQKRRPTTTTILSRMPSTLRRHTNSGNTATSDTELVTVSKQMSSSDSDINTTIFPSNAKLAFHIGGTSNSLQDPSASTTSTFGGGSGGGGVNIPQLQVALIASSSSPNSQQSPGTARLRRGFEKLSNLIKTPRSRTQSATTPPDDSHQQTPPPTTTNTTSAAGDSERPRFFRRKRPNQTTTTNNNDHGNSNNGNGAGEDDDHHESMVLYNSERRLDPKHYRYSIEKTNAFGETALYIAVQRLKDLLIEEQDIRDPLLQKKILETKKKNQQEITRSSQNSLTRIETTSNNPLAVSTASIYSSPSSTEKSTSKFLSLRRLSTVHYNMEKYWESFAERLSSIDSIVHLLFVSKSSLKVKSVKNKDVTIHNLIQKVIDECDKLPDEGNKISSMHANISIKYSLFLKGDR